MENEHITQPETTVEMVEVVDIQFRPGQKVYYFAPNGKFVKTFGQNCAYNCKRRL